MCGAAAGRSRASLQKKGGQGIPHATGWTRTVVVEGVRRAQYMVGLLLLALVGVLILATIDLTRDVIVPRERGVVLDFLQQLRGVAEAVAPPRAEVVGPLEHMEDCV